MTHALVTSLNRLLYGFTVIGYTVVVECKFSNGTCIVVVVSVETGCRLTN